MEESNSPTKVLADKFKSPSRGLMRRVSHSSSKLATKQSSNCDTVQVKCEVLQLVENQYSKPVADPLPWVLGGEKVKLEESNSPRIVAADKFRSSSRGLRRVSHSPSELASKQSSNCDAHKLNTAQVKCEVIELVENPFFKPVTDPLLVTKSQPEFLDEDTEFADSSSKVESSLGGALPSKRYTVATWRKIASMKPTVPLHQYSQQFKCKVLEFSKSNSLGATSSKFHVHRQTVYKWRKEANMEPRSYFPHNSEKLKAEVLQFSQQNSYTTTSSQYNIHPQTVYKWRKEANMDPKLPQQQYSEKLKSDVLEFSKTNSCAATGRHYNVPKGTVEMWRKEAQMEPRIYRKPVVPTYHQYPQLLKCKVLEFSKSNSLRATSKKFHVSHQTVRQWRKDANMEARIYLPQNSEKLKAKVLHFSKSNSYSVTSRKFKIHRQTVYKWRKEANMKPRLTQQQNFENLKSDVLEFSESNSCGETVDKKIKVSGMSKVTQNSAPASKCDACGYTLAADETLDEHLVSLHLTREGLCDVCGEDPLDFMEHFKKHLGIWEWEC